MFLFFLEYQCLINGSGGVGGGRVTPVRGFLQTYSEEPGKYIYIIFFFRMENEIRSSKSYFHMIYCKQVPQKFSFFPEYVSQSVKNNPLYMCLKCL